MEAMGRVGHFLVVVWDGGGNVVPAAGLTAALVDHGHDVRVIGPAELQTRFERAGARFRPRRRRMRATGVINAEYLTAWKGPTSVCDVGK